MADEKDKTSKRGTKGDTAPDAGTVSGVAAKEAKKTAKPKKTAAEKTASSGTKKAGKPARKDAGISSGKYNIGIDVGDPEGTCTDSFCPFHGTLPVRGQILEGYVVSDKMQRTAVVKRDYMRENKKYERLEKRSGKYLVHNPPCLGVKTGDNVKIMECRPLSKLVSFVIVEKM